MVSLQVIRSACFICILLLRQSSCWIIKSQRIIGANRPWVSSSTKTAISGLVASPSAHESHHQAPYDQDDVSIRDESHTLIEEQDKRKLGPTRRQWLTRLAMASGSTAAALGFPSNAPAIPVVTTPATCDATVSVFQRGNRIIYLLGTAHISQVSADLARSLVRDAHPNAVFVELDLKRVGGLMRNASKDTPGLQEYVPEDTLTAGTQPRILVPTMSSDVATVATDASTVRKPAESGGWFQRQILGIAAASVGKALKSMYSNLGESGFSPGEEFRVAMEEARLSDATIVLGDQDVEITLKRLTQALGQTDFQTLQTPEMEEKLSKLLGTNALPPVRSDYDSAEEFKNNLSAYVEQLKSRENVRAIMASLKEVAPELVKVMLTERDLYMATGLDAIQNFEVTVAVMGIAHQDGVEANLRNFGWKSVRLACP